NCIAAHASDLAVALVALDATVEVRGAGGSRTVTLNDLYRLPNATPHLETVLEPGEVIAAVTVPASPATRRSHYLKVRDRASFEFALVSAAARSTWTGRTFAGRTSPSAVSAASPGACPGSRRPWREPISTQRR